MWFNRRWLVVLALTGVTLVSACGCLPADKRSKAEVLAIGQSRLDAIELPEGVAAHRP